MLRDAFNGSEELREVLLRYEGVEFTQNDWVEIKMAKKLSPDSFIWKLEILGQRYYLYAEDYVDSLRYAISNIEEVAGTNTGTLLRVKLDDTPERSNEPSTYATRSGYDNIFLYKINSAASRPTKGTTNG